MIKFDIKNKLNIFLMIVVSILALVAGIYTGNLYRTKQIESIKQQNIDETIGLAERTGMTGELSLAVKPTKLSVVSGEPLMVELSLKNNTGKSIFINGWLTPAPSSFGSNQLAFKQNVTIGGKTVRYKGNIVIFDPHKKSDFIALDSGESHTLIIDLSKGPNNGIWEITNPGIYNIELWYETYLTGQYTGVKSWTGMTNHVIVNVTVLPRK